MIENCCFFPYFHFSHGKIDDQRHRQSQMTAGDRIKTNTLRSSLKMCLEQLFNLLAGMSPSPPVWNLLIRAITWQNHRQEQWPQMKLTWIKEALNKTCWTTTQARTFMTALLPYVSFLTEAINFPMEQAEVVTKSMILIIQWVVPRWNT